MVHHDEFSFQTSVNLMFDRAVQEKDNSQVDEQQSIIS